MSTSNPSALLYSIKTKLQERFISFWKKRLSSEEGMKKLRTYVTRSAILVLVAVQRHRQKT